jgi:hypothetical protein
LNIQEAPSYVPSSSSKSEAKEPALLDEMAFSSDPVDDALHKQASRKLEGQK